MILPEIKIKSYIWRICIYKQWELKYARTIQYYKQWELKDA